MNRVALALSICMVGARALAAQVTTDSLPALGAIDGVVSDSALTPLSGASVTMLRTNTGPSRPRTAYGVRRNSLGSTL